MHTRIRIRAVARPSRWARRSFHALGLLIVTLPLVALALGAMTSWQGFYWIGPTFALGLVSLLDLVGGEDASNPTEAERECLEKDGFYTGMLFVTVGVEFLSLSACLLALRWIPMPWYHALGLALTMGVATAIAINTSHELGHRRGAWTRLLARVALVPAAYTHFHVEHNRGHHLRVATAEDPASARYGESFYRFLPRTLAGGFASAWRLEAARMARGGRSAWSWRSEVVQGIAITAAAWTLCVAIVGTVAWPFLVVQAFYGVVLLESVNYVEHYGLARQRQPDGRYEQCGPQHSWNSDTIVSNLLLYNLQRHSDHHANPLVPFQCLRSRERAPQLPTGYAAMILCCHVPWLWFRVMNPRVVRLYGGDLRRANRDPSLA